MSETLTPWERDMEAVNKIRKILDDPVSDSIGKESFEVYFTRIEEDFREDYEIAEDEKKKEGKLDDEYPFPFSEKLASSIRNEYLLCIANAEKKNAIDIILANLDHPESDEFKAGVEAYIEAGAKEEFVSMFSRRKFLQRGE